VNFIPRRLHQGPDHALQAIVGEFRGLRCWRTTPRGRSCLHTPLPQVDAEDAGERGAHRYQPGRAMFLFTGLRKSELAQSDKLPDVVWGNHSILGAGEGEPGPGGTDGPALAASCGSTVGAAYARQTAPRCRLRILTADLPRWFEARDPSWCSSTRMKFYGHTLRHTFATLCWRAACDHLRALAMMGHSASQTTTITGGQRDALRSGRSRGSLNVLRTPDGSVAEYKERGSLCTCAT